MSSIEATVTDKIVVDRLQLPEEVFQQICDELTVVNREREYAERTKRYGWWDLPEYFEFFDVAMDVLIMPRGYAMQFKLLCREHGIKVMWRLRWKYKRGEPYGRDEFSYLVHQPEAVRQLRRHWQGIYIAPTGSGKTVVICGYLWETHPEKALILVDKKTLVKQWVNRIHQHIGPDVKVGTIVEGKRTDGRIIVATLQALHAAIKNDEDWVFQLIAERRTAASVVVVDECHHCPARSYRQVVDRCIARDRLGATASPKKGGEQRLEIAQTVLGEIIYEDDEDELKESGIIGDPVIRVVKSDFEFAYWGDHQSDDDGDCEVPGCKRRDVHRHQSNYGKAKQALVVDEARNHLIAETINGERGKHHHLVITNEVKQLEAIFKALVSVGVNFEDINVLKGGMTDKQQQKIIGALEESDESITLSTVASEGLDFTFDRGYLVFPTSDPEKTKQEVGRFRRVPNAVIYDFADTNVKVFAKQFRKRRYQCYDALKLEVKM